MSVDTTSELMRLWRAAERISPIVRVLRLAVDLTGSVRELAPELGPELDAVVNRASDSLEHLQAALDVLTAKVDLT